MSYNSCKISDYSRINPNSGTGFILERLHTCGPMKRAEVYENTRYHYRDGFHSSIWAKLLEDKLIAADGGFIMTHSPRNYTISRPYQTVRAHGRNGNAPVYHITNKGLNILRNMYTRLNEK